MKRKIILFFLLAAGFPNVEAQFHRVLPVDDLGHHYADTLLNSKVLLVKNKVRKVTTYRDAPEGKRKAFKDSEKCYDPDGNILTSILCWHKITNYDSIICLKDSFQYDMSKNEAVMLMFILANGQAQASYRAEWISDSIRKTTAIFPVPKHLSNFPETNQDLVIDTSYWYDYYDKEGKLRSTFSEMKDTSYVNYFGYYPDGLLATLSDDKSKSIFKRSEKDGEITLKYGNSRFLYQWVYNSHGQCTEYLSRNGSLEKKYETHVVYEYYKTGLLRSVTIQYDNRPTIKYYYSYSKE